jgi:hypothetical protein
MPAGPGTLAKPKRPDSTIPCVATLWNGYRAISAARVTRPHRSPVYQARTAGTKFDITDDATRATAAYPPATAGMTDTCPPAGTGVSSPCANRTSWSPT